MFVKHIARISDKSTRIANFFGLFLLNTNRRIIGCVTRLITFTDHAIQRITKRKLTNEEVIEAIRYPSATIKRQGKYYFRKELMRGGIEVCCEISEKDIKVITVYWI